MSSPYDIVANYRRALANIDTDSREVRRLINESNLQKLVDKLNMERRVRGDELIPSVEEFRAEETQNNAAAFEFVKFQVQAAFGAGVIADHSGDDRAIIKVVDDSTKAIIKFFEERS